VVAVEHGARLVAGDGHGHALDLPLRLVEAAYRRDKRDAQRTASTRINGCSSY